MDDPVGLEVYVAMSVVIQPEKFREQVPPLWTLLAALAALKNLLTTISARSIQS